MSCGQWKAIEGFKKRSDVVIFALEKDHPGYSVEKRLEGMGAGEKAGKSTELIQVKDDAGLRR